MTEAKLLIAPGCQYCTAMMNLLGDLLKEEDCPLINNQYCRAA